MVLAFNFLYFAVFVWAASFENSLFVPMRLVVVFLWSLICSISVLRAVDLDADGLSDVWEQNYGAGDLLSLMDDDGDGFNNEEEETAGTDPWDANDFPKSAPVWASPGGVPLYLSFETKPGKLYQVSDSQDSAGFYSAGAGDPG